ncbi:hypothetical protein VTK26DRAFT_8491 [Humicola hyalothermophila]
MAPLIEQTFGLVKRDDDCPGANEYRDWYGICRKYSSWHWWGRWVFAGLCVLFILIVFALLFRNSRRRRMQGRQPIYGTGWMAPPAYYPPPPQYTPQDPAASYPPPPGGHKYGQNDGYYYGNQEGIQLQQPPHTYQRDPEPEYAPPPGPPPNAHKP